MGKSDLNQDYYIAAVCSAIKRKKKSTAVKGIPTNVVLPNKTYKNIKIVDIYCTYSVFILQTCNYGQWECCMFNRSQHHLKHVDWQDVDYAITGHQCQHISTTSHRILFISHNFTQHYVDHSLQVLDKILQNAQSFTVTLPCSSCTTMSFLHHFVSVANDPSVTADTYI